MRLGFFVLAAACAMGVFAFRPADDKLKVIKGYREWKKATPNIQDMTPSMAYLCVGPSPANSPPNPHVPRVFLVYVNKVGSKAMMAVGKSSFPDGTVIVKEKYARPLDLELGESADPKKVLATKPELLTVMVKKDGNWDYFAVDAEGKVMEGDTKYCRDCHASAKTTDSVFRPYLMSKGALKPAGG